MSRTDRMQLLLLDHSAKFDQLGGAMHAQMELTKHLAKHIHSLQLRNKDLEARIVALEHALQSSGVVIAQPPEVDLGNLLGDRT